MLKKLVRNSNPKFDVVLSMRLLFSLFPPFRMNNKETKKTIERPKEPEMLGAEKKQGTKSKLLPIVLKTAK